jgi:hypothetical protein
MTALTGETARAGDRINVVGHNVGDAAKSGEILEVLGDPKHAHFRVRWEDGHESLLYPGSDVAFSRTAL